MALRFPCGPVAIVHPLDVILHHTSISLSPPYDLAHLVHVPSIKVFILQPMRVRVRVRVRVSSSALHPIALTAAG